MSEENDDTDEDDTEEVEDDDTPSESLPMERVNALLKRESRKASRNAVKGLLTDLGLESADDLKTLVTTARDRQDSERTELERAQATAAEADRKVREAEARAAKAELSDRIGRALRTHQTDDGEPLSVREDRYAVALDMALGHALDLDEDDEDRVAAGVARVLTASPEWFGSGQSGGDDDGSAGNGRTPPVRNRGPNDRKRKKQLSAAERGREAARGFGATHVPPLPPRT